MKNKFVEMKTWFFICMKNDWFFFTQVWLRIAVALIAIATMQPVPLMLALFLPIFAKRSLSLGETPEEVALLEKIKGEVKKEIKQHLEATNKEGEKAIENIVTKRLEIYKDLPVDKLKTVVNDLDEINKAIAQLKAQKAAKKTFAGKKENLLQKRLKEVWPDMQKALAERKAYQFSLGPSKKELELEGEKINSTSFGAGVIRGFREAGIDFEKLPELFILDLIQTMTGGPGSNPLSWVERNKAVVGGAGANLVSALNPTSVAEEAAKPIIGWTWVVKEAVARTIAALVTVTKQSVFNYPMLEQEVRGELMRELAVVLQDQIINGDGTNNTMFGIKYYATPFAAPAGFGEGVPAANVFDVIVAAATQIIVAGYTPNFTLLNPVQVGLMQVQKNADGVYIMPPFATNNGLNVYGTRVYGTRAMVGDEFIVGDSTKSLFNWVENINIEIGMINDDFQKNIWRIRGELQGMHRIKAHEAEAFVKGDLSVAMAALDPAVV